MNLRAPSLTVVFVGALVLSAAALFGYEAVHFGSTLVSRMRANPVTFAYFALATVATATLVVFFTMLVREYRRAKRPEMSEYRQALKTGRITGDVGRWPDWIRHDRKLNLWRAGAAVWFVWWGVMGLVAGPWWNVWMLAMGAYWVGEYWRTRQRLKNLREKLSTPSASAR